MLLRNARKALLTIFLLLPLLVSGAVVAQATPEGDHANTVAGDVGVLGGCDWMGCGTVTNATGRGFHVTLLWGAPWSDEIIRWVAPYSTLGLPQWVDVDGVYVGSGCTMTGSIAGRPPVPHPPVPFVWGQGWHRIRNNQTALVVTHIC